jgi:hypothetical protein
MMVNRFDVYPDLPEDLALWYAEAEPGDTLYIPVPQLEWRLRLMRRPCGITWRPPGGSADVPVWLEQVASILSHLVAEPVPSSAAMPARMIEF